MECRRIYSSDGVWFIFRRFLGTTRDATSPRETVAPLGTRRGNGGKKTALGPDAPYIVSRALFATKNERTETERDTGPQTVTGLPDDGARSERGCTRRTYISTRTRGHMHERRCWRCYVRHSKSLRESRRRGRERNNNNRRLIADDGGRHNWTDGTGHSDWSETAAAAAAAVADWRSSVFLGARHRHLPDGPRT